MNKAEEGPSQRIEHIDGLRGVAISLVALFHLWIFSGQFGGVFWNPLSYGYTGVHLFLVISGFCVCWPYAKGQPFALHEFALRRAYRLMPPYLVALGCFAVAAVAFARIGWNWPEYSEANTVFVFRYTISHALLIHNLLPNHILAINGPFWSIALEAQLYLTVPLIVVLMRKYGVGQTLLIAATTTILFRFAVLAWYGGVANINKLDTLGYVIMHSLPARWFEFVLGASAAYMLAMRRHLLPAGVLMIFGLLALVSGACAVRILGERHPLPDPLFGIGYFLLLLSGAASSRIAFSRWCMKGMTWRPLVVIGQISFSIYLVHQPFIRLFCGWLHRYSATPATWFVCSLCLVLPVTLLLSITFYWFVERRSIHLAGKRLAHYKVLRALPRVPDAVIDMIKTKIA